VRNKHTTLPWSCWNGEIDGIGRNKHAYDEGLIAKMPNMSSPKQQANARFIVHACNSHDELVELLELALDRFTDNDMMPPNYALNIWLEKAKQALAKVKEVER